jgi:hypothetical protein
MLLREGPSVPHFGGPFDFYQKVLSQGIVRLFLTVETLLAVATYSRFLLTSPTGGGKVRSNYDAKTGCPPTFFNSGSGHFAFLLTLKIVAAFQVRPSGRRECGEAPTA